MWKKPGTPVPIDPSQLAVGLYVWLDLNWTDHPFMTNRLMVKTAEDVAIIQALNLAGHLYYYPDNSTVAPGAIQTEPPPVDTTAAAAAQAQAVAQELRRMEKLKKDQLRLQKDAATRADQAWNNAARATREALLNLTRSPKIAGAQLTQLSKETASIFAKGHEVLLHLLGDKKDQGPHFHALNTLTLCMLVGKKAGLDERELASLAMGALAHDAGEAQIPPHILKNAHRKPHEEDFYRQHVPLGLKFAAESGAFNREALAIIADHHEAVDGSGWPKGKRDASVGARILSIADRYDSLCSPEATGRTPLMPAEALATMFRSEGDHFDPALLTTLIKLLGVYPPGTVVQLSDGSLAIVVAPGAQSLKPKVLIYNPEVSKDDAPVLEIDTEPDLKIVEAIRPATLPADVLLWLNPQQRMSYFFSVEDGSPPPFAGAADHPPETPPDAPHA